jgi:hypothetical protein
MAATIASLADGVRQLLYKEVNNTYAGSAQRQFTGVPSNFTIATADATVFTLAAGEIGVIQNLHATVGLAVKKGAGASASSLNFVLPPGSATDTGGGGKQVIDDWVGVVSVAACPSGVARYIAWKQAP